MFKRKKKKTGTQMPSQYNPPPMPPVKPPKPRTRICSMKLEDLKGWVKTKAQFGDIAYCYDHMSEHCYIYYYFKLDDNPCWIDVEFFRKYFKKENKGDKEVFGTMNCTYSTPCGWCAKWDKKCDKKIGGYPTVDPNDKTPTSDTQKTIDYIKSGKGLPPIQSGIRKEF